MIYEVINFTTYRNIIGIRLWTQSGVWNAVCCTVLFNHTLTYLLFVYHLSPLLVRGRGFAGLTVYGSIIIIFSVAKSIFGDLCYLLVIGRTMLIRIPRRTLFNGQNLRQSSLQLIVVG